MATLKCTKSFYMNTGEIAFIQGVSYPIRETNEEEGDIEFTLESEVDHVHFMPWDEHVQAFFELIKED